MIPDSGRGKTLAFLLLLFILRANPAVFPVEPSSPTVPARKNVPTPISTIEQLSRLSEDLLKLQLPIQIETEFIAFDTAAHSLYTTADGGVTPIWLQNLDSTFNPGARILIEGKTFTTNGQPGVVQARVSSENETPPHFASIAPGQPMTNDILWVE